MVEYQFKLESLFLYKSQLQQTLADEMLIGSLKCYKFSLSMFAQGLLCDLVVGLGAKKLNSSEIVTLNKSIIN